MTGFMEELIQPNQVRMANVSSGLEIQSGQIPGSQGERGVVTDKRIIVLKHYQQLRLSQRKAASR